MRMEDLYYKERAKVKERLWKLVERDQEDKALSVDTGGYDIDELFFENGEIINEFIIEGWYNEFMHYGCKDMNEFLNSLEFDEDDNFIEGELTKERATQKFLEILEKHEATFEAYDYFDYTDYIRDFDVDDYVRAKAEYAVNKHKDLIPRVREEFEKVCKLVEPIQESFEKDEISKDEAVSKFLEIVKPYDYETYAYSDLNDFECFGSEESRCFFAQGMIKVLVEEEG